MSPGHCLVTVSLVFYLVKHLVPDGAGLWEFLSPWGRIQ